MRLDWRLCSPFNGLLSRTSCRVSRHRKGKPFWILLEQEMMRWQWHQLDHMQIICTSRQTDNHASTSPLSFFTGRMPFLPPNQQPQSIEGKSERASAKSRARICYSAVQSVAWRGTTWSARPCRRSAWSTITQACQQQSSCGTTRQTLNTVGNRAFGGCCSSYME